MRSAPALVSLMFALGATADVRAETEVPPPPKPWLGIGFSEDMYGWATVSDVHPGTGAAAVGLQPRDKITAIDGIPIGPGVTLPDLITKHKVGDRVVLTVKRQGRYGERTLRLVPRLSAMPTTDELVYRRLYDRSLPVMTLFDRHDAEVPLADWTRRPQVWVVFDARCDACGSAASALRTRLVDSDDGAADVPLRSIILGRPEELGAYMARVPLVGTTWRAERGIDPDDPQSAIDSLMRYFLSGIDFQNDGVILVVDHRGIVRFATAISAGDAAHEGACAAAARAARAWRP